jgi:hypothetical protein
MLHLFNQGLSLFDFPAERFHHARSSPDDTPDDPHKPPTAALVVVGSHGAPGSPGCAQSWIGGGLPPSLSKRWRYHAGMVNVFESAFAPVILMPLTVTYGVNR